MEGRLGGDWSVAAKEVESSPRGRQEAAQDLTQQELGKPASSGRRGQQSWRPHPFHPWGPGPWGLHAHPLRGCSHRSPRVRPASSGAGTPWRSRPPHLPPRASLRPQAMPKGRLSPSDTRQTGALARGNRVTWRCCHVPQPRCRPRQRRCQLAAESGHCQTPREPRGWWALPNSR